MAKTDYYVDPSINANSGTGTIGDPYGDLQYALDSITRNTTDGDAIHIKAGAAEVLTATLSFATYGVPGTTAGILFKGYTAVKDDGGKGEIDGNGAYGIVSQSGTNFEDMYLHNCGAATVVNTSYSSVVNCEIANTTGTGVVMNRGAVMECNIHNVGTYGINATGDVLIAGNYIKQGASQTMTAAISGAASTTIHWNIISVDSTSHGIQTLSDGSTVMHNTFFNSTPSTATGRAVYGTNTQYGRCFGANLIEGWNGTGGYGLYTGNDSEPSVYIGANAVYLCTNPYGAYINMAGDDNETLSSSPFLKDGADTFANRRNFFAPASVGNVVTGGLYIQAKGAVQQPIATLGKRHPLARF